MKTRLHKLAMGAAAMALAIAAGQASAGAIITNGTITLGVNDLGNLNVPGGAPSSGTGTSSVGLRYNAIGAEATAPGCLCEGWGVGLVGAATAGYANVAVGTSGLSLVSFASTASTATSVTTMAGMLEITHYYHPTANANIYAVDVSIKNISGSALAAGDLVYRRVMDWDVEPTAFAEYVTIAGVPALLGLANGNNIKQTTDNGFASANPLSGAGTISCPADVNFTDCGAADHGALFDFEFEALADGATRTFSTFYGAAGDEAGALAALSAVGAGLYSLGQPSSPGGPETGAPNTFMFGFGGSGGVLDPVPPTDIPEPSSLLLLGMGAAALAYKRRRA